MSSTSTILRTVTSGLVSGFLAPLTAISFGPNSLNIHSVPTIRVNNGSFATDQKKIGMDFRSAIRAYESEKNTSQKTK